jgi:hypothetical protein
MTMAQQNLQDTDTGPVAKDKIQGNFTELYAGVAQAESDAIAAAAIDATTKANTAQSAAIAAAATDATSKANAAQSAAIAAAATDATTKANAAQAAAIAAAATDATTKANAAQAASLPVNDPSVTNAREWTADTVTQADAEAGTGTTRVAWTVLRVWQAIAAWWAASAMKTKLDGIATGATANATNAELRDRATHTGTQAAGTITGLATVATSGAYSDLSGLPTASLDVVDVSSSRSVTAADDGKMLRATTAITLTWPSGLSPQPNILVMPPASGSVSLAASGTTLNAASTTLTRSRAANPAGVAVMSQGANAYGVSGA